MFIGAFSPRSSGKTTVMAWLLHALSEAGYPVKGFDADESEQFYRWWEAGDYPFEVEQLASSRFQHRGTTVQGLRRRFRQQGAGKIQLLPRGLQLFNQQRGAHSIPDRHSWRRRPNPPAGGRRIRFAAAALVIRSQSLDPAGAS